jgi:anti-sigma-K factor RskA
MDNNGEPQRLPCNIAEGQRAWQRRVIVRRVITQVLIVLCLAGGLAGGCAKTRLDPPPVTDAAITAAVKRALAADAGSNFQRVNVETKNATVTLTGAVELWAERARAEALAYKAAGVRNVVNGLRVE